MTKQAQKKIGIINFNPDQEPNDTREYVKRIGAFTPSNIKHEGISFRSPTNLSQYDALILSGSKLSASNYQEMKTSNLIHEPDYLHIQKVEKALYDFKGNMFGICFGAQLIAITMGGWIGRLPETEAGFLEHELTGPGKKDPLFKHLSETFHAPHLHQDYVEALPDNKDIKNAAILATKDSFTHIFHLTRTNGAKLYGVQAHPEMCNPDDYNFLVKANQDWLGEELGHQGLEDALAKPHNPNFSFAKTITQFAKSI